jgi:hypothetical protein
MAVVNDRPLRSARVKLLGSLGIPIDANALVWILFNDGTGTIIVPVYI